VIDDRVQRHSQEVPPALPPAAPRSRLANEAVVAGNWPHPTSYGRTDTTRLNGVDRTGRATSVPFTTVLPGSQRTITDNATAGMTCTDHRFPR
jgi:hypothetical protein